MAACDGHDWARWTRDADGAVLAIYCIRCGKTPWQTLLEAIMPNRIEDKSQEEVLLLMRAAIDTAITSPGPETTNSALELATRYPRALAGGKLRANLGQERWDWLAEHGIYPMSFGVTEPDITT